MFWLTLALVGICAGGVIAISIHLGAWGVVDKQVSTRPRWRGDLCSYP